MSDLSEIVWQERLSLAVRIPDNSKAHREDQRTYSGLAIVKLSIIIPTKNAGAFFEHILDAVIEQIAPWPYQILVIDSSSTDATRDYCTSRNIPVHVILPAEFGHGRTRNLAISLTRSEFIVLLTQDALPTGRYWLANLVEAVEQDTNIAGAFGRQIPYPEADPYTSRDIDRHFGGLLKWPKVLRLDDPERYRQDECYRRALHFFSDCNACIRRSVWEKHPFPEVDYAEDQIWAKTVIEHGYAKAYAYDAAVYHSHNYSVIETGRRTFDESAALKSLFGYRLCPTLSQVLRRSIWHTREDIAYSRQLGKLREHFFWMMRAPFFNLSRQLGFYLGEKAALLPDWLRRRISLDASRKDGRR